jgi:hypothetical protein
MVESQIEGVGVDALSLFVLGAGWIQLRVNRHSQLHFAG